MQMKGSSADSGTFITMTYFGRVTQQCKDSPAKFWNVLWIIFCTDNKNIQETGTNRKREKLVEKGNLCDRNDRVKILKEGRGEVQQRHWGSEKINFNNLRKQVDRN